MNDDRMRTAPDRVLGAAGPGHTIQARSCNQCHKPKAYTGGGFRFVRGLVKKAWCCAGCVVVLDAKAAK